MAGDSSVPDSPLSSMASVEEFGDEIKEPLARPFKRPKLEGDDSTASSAAAPPDLELPGLEPDDMEPADLDPPDNGLPGVPDGVSDVSSDTSGSVASSPSRARPDEEQLPEPRATACAWKGCVAGDLGNPDQLVEHILREHIHREPVEDGARRYTCEWLECHRKPMKHATLYTLKAHMRKHTREKPFYCHLPECDSSFVRSDALSKHMRIAHEVDNVRPYDAAAQAARWPTPAAVRASKLKIVIKSLLSAEIDDTTSCSDGGEAALTALTEQQGFLPDELAMRPDQLFGLCQRQLRWAEQEREEIGAETVRLEEVYKTAWFEKEALLTKVIASEIDRNERRQAIVSGAVHFKVQDIYSPLEASSTPRTGG